MISDPTSLGARRSDRSDKFYVHLTSLGTLDRLLRFFLGERRIESPFASIKNHDDRAALVCALTALCVAGHEFTAVGDKNGWIILPPINFIQPWGKTALEANNREEQGTSFYVSRREVEKHVMTSAFLNRPPSI